MLHPPLDARYRYGHAVALSLRDRAILGTEGAARPCLLVAPVLYWPGPKLLGETLSACQALPAIATTLRAEIVGTALPRGAMPFTQEQFLGVFRDYNIAVWPAQWLLDLLAILALGLAARGKHARGVSLILALLWAWTAIVYHWTFFSRINGAAVWFGIAFLIQALVFVWFGVARRRIRFEARWNVRTLLGLVLIVYALLLYPALGYLLGRRYPSMPTFGLPCPTTIFTFGLLLWAVPPLPLSVIAVPALWSLLGFSAATSLGITEDYGLLIAALVAVPCFIHSIRLARRADTHRAVTGDTPPHASSTEALRPRTSTATPDSGR